MAEDAQGNTGGSKILIDSDWKAEAQREKERLKQKEQAKQGGGGSGGGGGAAATGGTMPSDPRGGGGGAQASPRSGGGARQEIPPASFEGLMNILAMQALSALGAFPDPQTGQRVAYLDLARHHIDLLAVLEEKSKGNLTEEEADVLAQTLYELRQQYVAVAQASRQGGAGGGAGGAGGGGGGVRPAGVVPPVTGNAST